MTIITKKISSHPLSRIVIRNGEFVAWIDTRRVNKTILKYRVNFDVDNHDGFVGFPSTFFNLADAIAAATKFVKQ